MSTSTSDTHERRIDALDVLRGVAILGTLGTNTWIFTDPGGIIGYLTHAPRVGTTGDTVELVLRFLVNGMFLGPPALLFGIGLELRHRSARRPGRRWPGWYLWRAALLLVEGALHFLLVFEGDVLTAYALTSVTVVVVGAWLGICLLFSVLATGWLRHAGRGPVELVWQWAYHVPERWVGSTRRAPGGDPSEPVSPTRPPAIAGPADSANLRSWDPSG